MQPFAERLGLGQATQVLHHLVVMTQLQLGLQTILGDRQAQSFQPGHLGRHRSGGRHVGQDGAAPQAQRVAEPRGGGVGAATGEAGPAEPGQPLEPAGVDVVVGDDQLVAALPGHQPAARLVAEPAPQPQHVVLDRADRGPRRSVTPDLVGEPVGRHDPAVLDEQDRENEPLLRRVHRGPDGSVTHS